MALHIPAQLALGFLASKLAVLVYMERYFGERSRIATMSREEALAYIDERIREWERAGVVHMLLRKPMLARLRSIRALVADAPDTHPSKILNTDLDRMYREVKGVLENASIASGKVLSVFGKFFGSITHEMGDALQDVLGRVKKDAKDTTQSRR